MDIDKKNFESGCDEKCIDCIYFGTIADNPLERLQCLFGLFESDWNLPCLPFDCEYKE